MKVLLIIASLLVLLLFAIYQMRIAFKNIQDSKINPPNKDKDDTEGK